MAREVVDYSKIAVLGAGNVGLGVAGMFALSGHDVSLFDLPRYSETIEAVRSLGGIEVDGPCGEGYARPTIVTGDIGRAIRGRGILLYCVPAYAQEEFMRQSAPHLQEGQVLVFLSCYGALRMGRLLREVWSDKAVIVSETMSCPYLSSKTALNRVLVKRKRQHLLFAAFPGERTEEALGIVREVLPDLESASNCLETSINNTNPILHATTCAMTAGWIEATKGDFNFVLEGFTPSVVRLQHAVDKEKMRVANALGVTCRSADEWIMSMYNVSDIAAMRSYTGNPQDLPKDAPKSLQNHRYMLEDVAYGLVPIAGLADVLDLDTPATDAVIDLCSIIAQVDFWTTGASPLALGLSGLSGPQIERFLHTGQME